MAFRVGQKVVYIGDAPFNLRRWWLALWHPEPADHLIVGRVYQISNITPEQYLELVGINSQGDQYWYDGFLPECFRPAVERKTDISALTALLVPGAKIREPA